MSTVNSVNTMTPTKNTREFLSAFAGCVDQFYTSGTKFDPLKLVAQFRLSNRETIAVQESLQLQVQDLELLAIDADDQITEGYSNITKAQSRELLGIYHTILEIPTAPTRERKIAPVDGTHIKPVNTQRQPKIVQSDVIENYESVFAVATKYRCLRTFIGGVTIQGSKITADAIQEYRYPKNMDMSGVDFNTYTRQQFIDLMNLSKPIQDGSTTLVGRCVDSVHKFN